MSGLSSISLQQDLNPKNIIPMSRWDEYGMKKVNLYPYSDEYKFIEELHSKELGKHMP